ncbi:MAG: ABC transporter permease subunit [Streptosporangiales bacterium]|nr:ABC transporter permease subunit [Streptosporangiales bacterium]
MTARRPLTALRSWRPFLGYAAGLVAGVAAWQLIGLNSASFVFVPLTTTLSSLGRLISGGTMPGALASSFSVYAAGEALAIVAGAAVGLLLARRPLLRTAFEPYLTALYAIPMVALIPFLLALVGLGFWPKVIVVWLFAFFPVEFSTQRGAQSISPELLDVARSYRTSERQTWRHVVIPYTLPYLMTGVRQALARGLVGMIAAEFFLSAGGLGSLLITQSEQFDTGGMLATTLVITLAGVILMAAGRAVERRFARWRVTS